MKRKKTKKIFVGSVAVGGGAPVSVQSMTNTNTCDVKATVSQIRRLEKAGCDIARVAVPDDEASETLRDIVRKVNIPVVADIHFNYRLALKSIDSGAACIRINPGNIGNIKRLEKVINKAAEADIPIRVGINSGSLEKDILKKYGQPSAEALVESALRNINLIEKMHFKNIKVSIKSSDVVTSIEAYRNLSKKTRYPLHIGITEAGTAFSGTVKSSVGLGILLNEGIGDTLRVSLSADPVKEVLAGFEILKSLGLRSWGPELISCPTCARQQADVIQIAQRIEKKMAGFKSSFKVAVMGCEVNGPGEAKEADVGLAGSKKCGVIFKKGKIVKKVPKKEMFDAFFEEVKKLETS
jgi:(E)-4-hydroxy-3-methylbut-2-enyl-diphosphate synthase